MAGELVRDGQRVVDTVVTTPRRVKLASFLAKTKWARKGARGEVRDVKWPKPREGPDEFVRRWAQHMRAQSLRYSSGEEAPLQRILSAHADRERERMRHRRGS
ncbi:MAG: hypothetical protein ACRERD_24955, partial [Candidatus Binatia bacterium]